MSRVIAALVTLALAGACGAQSSVDESLLGTHPRKVCTPEDEILPVAPGAYRPLPAPDLACALEPAAVRAMLGKPDVVLVDTRRANEFAEFHIDSAMNMDWTRIRVSPFHGTHAIVLVGSGKAERSLYVACSELRRNGERSVHVLRGGMGRWISSGQPVIGRAPDLARYLTLTDEEFLDELSFASNLPLALPRAAALRATEPRVELLAGVEPAALTRALNKHAASAGAIPATGVLLLTGGARHAAWEKYSAASSPLPLLVYEGTPDQFKAFMRQKRAIWAAQARGPLELPCSL